MKGRRIKVGDEVVIIAGDSKGERGKVLQVLPLQENVLVEGVRKVKRHQKKGADQNSPEGGIIEREAPVHISNVMKAERYDERRGRRADSEGG